MNRSRNGNPISNVGCQSGFWWQTSPITQVAQFDYPSARLRAAEAKLRQRGGRFAKAIRRIVDVSASPKDVILNIARHVQQSVVHNPIFQPAHSTGLYPLFRRCSLDIQEMGIGRHLRPFWSANLIEEPDLLIELGEARCGQCAKMLCTAFQMVGFQAGTLQLENHIVTEVSLNNSSYLIDADAFKNGIFFQVGGELACKRDILENPYLVDRFKHTGWMFRQDSIYAHNLQRKRPYCGYIDLYSPEIDGQISKKYGARQTLYPPGVPRWKTPSESIFVSPGQKIALEYTCEFAERATGYRVRCGSRSKGYRYDCLIMENLANETSGEVFELETRENYVEVSLSNPGIYYLTVASIPYYLDEFPSYLWWSDELTIRVLK
jgi:hypothetical protein